MNIIYILLLVFWNIFIILLSFKVWGACNNINEIANTLRKKEFPELSNNNRPEKKKQLTYKYKQGEVCHIIGTEYKGTIKWMHDGKYEIDIPGKGTHAYDEHEIEISE